MHVRPENGAYGIVNPEVYVRWMEIQRLNRLFGVRTGRHAIRGHRA